MTAEIVQFKHPTPPLVDSIIDTLTEAPWQSGVLIVQTEDTFVTSVIANSNAERLELLGLLEVVKEKLLSSMKY